MEFKELNANDKLMTQVANIYINSWLINYADILPKWYLDKMDLDACIDRFNSYVEKENQGIILAKEGEKVLGFSAYMPCDRVDNSLLLEMLHINPMFQGKKVGKALITRTWDKAMGLGFDKMSISFMKKNNRAGEIYKHLGAEYLYDYYEELDGAEVLSELLVWRK
ncbi:MAG TPA: GNAT family N-acetyltransferase [Anaerovoracaceae bacterium]|nr:GNAT family N-acetyltransferase [Anaerovoracaceae bacterium]